MADEHPFGKLVGRKISQVIFVRDYVQILFDDEFILSCIANPSVDRMANEQPFLSEILAMSSFLCFRFQTETLLAK